MTAPSLSARSSAVFPSVARPAGAPRAGSVHYLLAERFHRMAFQAWGDPTAPVVVCVHGLTRNGRDVDALAAGLADRFRVICPDLPGRGGSDWLADPMLYQARHYVMSRFPDLESIERHLRLIHAPCGPLTDEQWAELARNLARALPDGRFAMHYDPRIAEPLRGHDSADVDMWPLWDRIRMPRLVIRGAASDLLLAETAERMAASGAVTHEVPETGHAPLLLDPAQIMVIRSFLTG